MKRRRRTDRAPGALWTCPACGRPVRIVPHPQIGAAGAHRPLEISRAIAAAGACTEAARFPQVHSAFFSLMTHTHPSIRGPVMMGNPSVNLSTESGQPHGRSRVSGSNAGDDADRRRRAGREPAREIQRRQAA